MDMKEKLVELISESLQRHIGKSCKLAENIADDLIADGVTVQDSKVVEIDQFKLPIDDAILILKEEHKQMADGYTTHLSYGGKGDPAEEANLDALAMAISALEQTKWISVKDRLPQNFVSVLGYMTDAGEFPAVRECYTVGNAFFFPALSDVHPVSHWMPMPKPPKGE